MISPPAHPHRPSGDQIESLERARRRMLVAVVIATTAWFLPQILHGVLAEGLPRAATAALIVVGVAGALVYVASMWRFHRFRQRVQGDPELRRRLDDERVAALRREAICRGWIVLVIALGVGVAAAPFVELPAQAVLLTLLLVAVDAPLVFFLALDRD